MKAAVFHQVGKPLAIENMSDPTPGPDQVVVQVGRCGICGSDLHKTEDPAWAAPDGAILGHEYAGEIVAVGTRADTVKIGDRVCVYPLSSCGHCASCLAGEPAWCDRRIVEGGGYAQYSLTAARQCQILPATVSIPDGALAEPLSVGLHGVAMAEMAPGDRVLVIGAGPIGLAALFWARKLGAGKIAVTARTDQRAELSMTMGASAFVTSADRSDEEFAGALDRVLGGPPDIVFECVGQPGVIERAVNLVRRRGKVVVLGLCFARDNWVPFMSVAKEVRIQPAAFFNLKDFQYSVDILDSGAVEPRAMVTDSVKLDDMPPMFEALRRRTHQCKVLVEP
jgi:(R,R)-butanediol dehydrogenase/meso-butanediol dehydrogenase/diacetyl reductase